METHPPISTHIVRALRVTPEIQATLHAITSEIRAESGGTLFKPRLPHALGVTVFNWKNFLALNRDKDTTYMQRLLPYAASASARSSILATVGSAAIYGNWKIAHIGFGIHSALLRAEHEAFREVGRQEGYRVPESANYTPHLSIGSFAVSSLKQHTRENSNEPDPLQTALGVATSYESCLARVVELDELWIKHSLDI